MQVNVLAGDSLFEPFSETGLEGEVVVCRECFVDGDLDAESLNDLWELRSKFLTGSYPEADQDYQTKVVDEFVRLWNLGDGNEIVMWFEYELFCQVNLWFTIWLLRNTNARFSVVYPKLKDESDLWKGFSFLSADELKESYDAKVRMNHDDVFLAVGLWESFQKRDMEKLTSLGETETKSFPTLKKVVEAASEIESRPKEAIRRIIKSGKTEFGEVFQEFSEKEPIYGFGDLQVKRIYDQVVGEED